MNKYGLILLVFLMVFVFSGNIFASIGVGVGTGKIVVEEKLKPGIIYKLPQIAVLNTGDEEGDYTVSVTYHEQQPEQKPAAEWFSFSPSQFHLKPNESQVVEITLDVPLKVVPGDYFAYLEASPVKKVNGEGSTVGIAAASKLYFVVDPANVVMGVYYRAVSLWNLYAPWPQRVSILLGAGVGMLLFKKYFNIEIKAKKSDEK
ncbi:hypothetical protein IT417_00160 [bacterium]|nr:hypothetical protein [bacterium]